LRRTSWWTGFNSVRQCLLFDSEHFRHHRIVVVILFGFLLPAQPASAGPITASLEGCVMLDDSQLATATWFASGTFQAVAFHDPLPGCDQTITDALAGAYTFDENRAADTLRASLNPNALPTCGRVQYDLHAYLAFDVLDPMGLKSLVVDTGIACGEGQGALVSIDGDDDDTHGRGDGADGPDLPEPPLIVLLALATSGLLAKTRFTRFN
jgi:hypothetical protein